MNNTNASHQIAATCLAITFILAGVAVAEDDTTADDDGQETLELITLGIPADVEAVNNASDGEEADPPLPGQESDLEELHRTFALYKSAIANNSYDEADTLAKRMVELAIGLFGLDSHESSKALMCKVGYRPAHYTPLLEYAWDALAGATAKAYGVVLLSQLSSAIQNRKYCGIKRIVDRHSDGDHCPEFNYKSHFLCVSGKFWDCYRKVLGRMDHGVRQYAGRSDSFLC